MSGFGDTRLPDRFWSKVEIADYGCWLWTASTWDGYGHFKMGKRSPRAHRVAYETLVGPIPQGLQLDHLCRVRACVNPSHLEPVTHAENIARGMRAAMTHCRHGHLYDEQNTAYTPQGHRRCRVCMNEQAKRWREANPHRVLEWRDNYNPRRRAMAQARRAERES